MNNRVFLQSGFVLHLKPYLNSSFIVRILTKDYGLISLVAKGVRRPKSKIKGMLQPFSPISVSYISKTQLGTLVDIENEGNSIGIVPAKLVYGMYLNELILKLLHDHDPHVALYQHYKKTIALLKTDTKVEIVLREFEINLLNEIGYGIDFVKESSSGNEIKSGQNYKFSIDAGFEKTDQLEMQRRVFCGDNILSMANKDFRNIQVLSDAKEILRNVISSRLGNYKLKSRSLLVKGTA